MTGICKSFGGVRALSEVDFDVRAGEVHGLVGENGAGKSTLIRIAAGTVRADAGQIFVNGQPVQISSPAASRACGIAVVHQEAELFGELSVAENMLLGAGLPRTRAGTIDWKQTYRRASEALARLGEHFDVRQPARQLRIAHRMIAEIAAAIDQQAAILFLDEPSSCLTHREVESLFRQVQRLRELGVAVVFVSHRLEEVKRLSDRITVLRDGQRIWTRPAADVEPAEIISAMVGRRTTHLFESPRRPTATPDPARRCRTPVLSVRHLTDAEGRFVDVSLDVYPGEILGLYGLIGAGRSELAQAIFGMRRIARGRILLDGEPIRPNNPAGAVRAGIAYLPEDRLVQGIFARLSVRLNTVVTVLRRWSWLFTTNAPREAGAVRQALGELDVRYSSTEQAIQTLSGGNQQKVVVARWLLTDPRVLLLDEPTRGVDVAAKAEIHRLIGRLAEAGKAIVLISSELPEVLAVSDRVLVLRAGHLAGRFDPRRDDETAIAAAALPETPTQGEPQAGPMHRARPLLRRLRAFGLTLALLAIVAVMSALRPENFATLDNALHVARSISILTIMALGATLVIASGGIDISVGSLLGLLAALAGKAALAGAPVGGVVVMALLLGAACGAINAAASLAARVHPIVITLAGISIYRGIMLAITGGEDVPRGIGSEASLPETFRAVAEGWWLGVPKLVWYAAAVTVAAGVLLRWTRTGRALLAAGGSPQAAALIGLPQRRLTLLAFAIGGALVGLAALLYAGYQGRVQSNDGEGMELQAIAAAVIGGCAITGGTASASGTALGALLIGLIYNALVLLGISSYWHQLFIGGLILAAVVLDRQLRRIT